VNYVTDKASLKRITDLVRQERAQLKPNQELEVRVTVIGQFGMKSLYNGVPSPDGTMKGNG